MAAKPEEFMAGGGNDLPHELWREILIRLPAKSILRYRSVCRSWYSLISCSNFVSDYSTANLKKNGNRLLLQLYDIEAFVHSCSSYVESFMESCEHDDFPETFLGENLEIVGSCNGLICLSKYDKDCRRVMTRTTLLIWNPTIRKVVEVPPRTFCPRAPRLYNLGFGFDSMTSDYKILCAARHGENDDFAYAFEIFDLRKGVWRAVSPPISSWNFDGSCYQTCYLDGIVHWILNRHGDNHRHGRDQSYDRILLSFNMRDEIFREIKLPDFVGFIGVDRIQARSVTFSRLIHFIALKASLGDIDLYKQGDCSIWAMKEYGIPGSWTKLFNIDLQSAQLHEFTFLHRFSLWRNGEVLVVHKSGYYHELLSYNIESRKFDCVFSTNKHILSVCLFEESLVSM